jgi:DNA-binding SARP family transcriptional activator
MLGNFALAGHHSARATACWEQLQNINGIVNNLIEQAEIKRDYGALGEAESLLQQALTLTSRPLHLNRLQGYVLVTQGELYQDQGLYDRSLAATEEGLALARQLGDAYLLKYALMTLALTYLYMKDAATARLLLSEIQFGESTETATPSLQQVQWRLAMGTVLLYQQHYVEARTLLEPAEARLNTMGYKRYHLKALIRLADCYRGEKQWRQALQRLGTVEKILASFDGYEQRVLAELAVLPELQQAIQQCPECVELRSLLHWQPTEPGIQEEQQKVFSQEASIEITEQSPSVFPALAFSEPAMADVTPRLKILAFGEPAVLVDGKAVTRWRMPRAMELCFYLLECKRPTRKEQLITELWEEVDAQVSQTFYSTIHYLRKALGGESTIKSRAGIYTLDLASIYGQKGVWYDVAVFEEQYALGKQALADEEEEAAKAAFETMVELYRGDYVQPFYSDWCSFPRDKLRRAYLDARYQLAQIAWRAEQIDESVAHWQQMLAVDPCLEEAHYGLMRCYIRQGKRGLVLRQYQRCSEKLQQELKVLPGSAIQNLYRRLMGLPKVGAEPS